MWKPKLPTSYAEQTHASPYRIVRYAHRQRYSTAIDLILSAKPRTLIDYGAGDGFLIEQLLQRDTKWLERIILYEPILSMKRVLEIRLQPSIALGRLEVTSRRDDLLGSNVEMILCMGVLEHLPLMQRDHFYDVCDQSLAPNGRSLIDVPVEIGLSILIKELGRMLVKGRRLNYSPSELIRATACRPVNDPKRFTSGDTDSFFDHKGFDYRVLLNEIASRLTVERTIATPLPYLPPWLGNQEVIFVARRTIGDYGRHNTSGGKLP